MRIKRLLLDEKKLTVRKVLLVCCLLFFLNMQYNVEAEQSFAEECMESEDMEDWISDRMKQMSMEEKAAQLFVITPEALTGMGRITAAGEQTRECFLQYPVGGLVYFSGNIESEDQLREMLQNIQNYSYEALQIPVFTCVDEEGGEVTRISGHGVLDVPVIGSMAEIGAGESEDAYAVGREIGTYLHRLGFTVDFAPVADVVTNSENRVIGSRAFGSNPEKAGEMVSMFVTGMHTQNVAACLKHFPGHGNTREDSHVSCAISDKTIEELRTCEWIPFENGIGAGADFVMVGHISLPNVTGDQTPATLSDQIITDLLRGELGYQGIVITDAMNMAAITDYYASDEAAIKTIQAGADLILMPYDFHKAYQGVLNAVSCGEISEERVNESVYRILELKYKITQA